jgi:hypothetical protein
MPDLVSPQTPVADPGRLGDGKELFASSNCEQIDLRYRVAREIFDWPRFLSFFGVDNDGDENKTTSVTCRTLDPENLDYHIHFRWNPSKDAFTLYVSFHAGVIRKSDGEREPYAEQFMPWLGSFFANETAHGDLHAEFEYQTTVRRSRFPLPIKVSLAQEIEAEISGIDVTFASTPDGISGAHIRQSKKDLNISVVGTTRTNFSTFDIKAEVGRLSSLPLRLTEMVNLQ